MQIKLVNIPKNLEWLEFKTDSQKIYFSLKIKTKKAKILIRPPLLKNDP